jgi:hypothetical protein
MENSKHRGNYKGTTKMRVRNQDMAFVTRITASSRRYSHGSRLAGQP